MSVNKNYLIVDGYNVIFAWPELKKIAKDSLEHARLELQHILQNYASYTGYDEVILVFDGRKTKLESTEEWISKKFLLVYTDEHETADAYIEKAVHEKDERFANIEVVTSDGAEQYQILGSGGLRIPVRELRASVIRMKKDEKNHYEKPKHYSTRNNVSALLDDDEIAQKLEKIRLNKS